MKIVWGLSKSPFRADRAFHDRGFSFVSRPAIIRGVSNEAHPFQIGGTYENRKGPFEVLSIAGDAMRIRWDSGEEADTEISFQMKILRNMERELAAPTSGKARRSSPVWFGENFTGLSVEDFSNDVTGTHWRSREQLGGAVTRLLLGNEPFNSWSIYKRPEVHWASVARYQKEDSRLLAKFFVRLRTDDAFYGLYFERSDEPAKNRDDWVRFCRWIAQPGHCHWLHETLLRTDALLTQPYEEPKDRAFNGSVSATAEHFVHESGTKTRTFAIADLPAFITALPEDKWLNFVIAKQLPRDAAIAEGADIASVLADFFNVLLPVYENLAPASPAAAPQEMPSTSATASPSSPPR